jgi:hypothetical protein
VTDLPATTGILNDAMRTNMADLAGTSGILSDAMRNSMANFAGTSGILNDAMRNSMIEATRALPKVTDLAATTGILNDAMRTNMADLAATSSVLNDAMRNTMLEAARVLPKMTDLDGTTSLSTSSETGIPLGVDVDLLLSQIEDLLHRSADGISEQISDPGLIAVWLEAASELRDWATQPRIKVLGSIGMWVAMSAWWVNLKAYHPEVADLVEVPFCLLAALLQTLVFLDFARKR